MAGSRTGHTNQLPHPLLMVQIVASMTPTPLISMMVDFFLYILCFLTTWGQAFECYLASVSRKQAQLLCWFLAGAGSMALDTFIL